MAVKELKKMALIDKDEIKLSLDEIKILENKLLKKCIGCEHIIKFVDSFELNMKTYIITKYYMNGDLDKVINNKECNYSTTDIYNWLTQLLQGINFLHFGINGCQIIHRDLKPANIFLRENNSVVIGDLGLARSASSINNSIMSTRADRGTPFYMAPECFKSKFAKITRKLDIWSYGCVLYEIIERKRMFEGESLWDIMQKIVNGNIKKIEKISQKQVLFQKILESSMSVNPSERPEAEEILKKMTEKPENSSKNPF